MVYPTGERDSWGWQVSHCTSSMTIFPRFESRPPKKGDCGINLTHHFSLPRHPSFILNAELWSAWRVERLQGLRRSLGNWDEEVSRTPTPQTTPRLLYFSIKHYRSHLDSVSGTGLRTGQALPRLLTQIYELATQSPFYTWESEVRAVTWTRNIDKQEQVDQGSGPGLPGPKAGTPRSPHGAPRKLPWFCTPAAVCSRRFHQSGCSGVAAEAARLGQRLLNLAGDACVP